MSSGSVVTTTFAPASTWSLGGILGADADCGLHRRHLEDGTCAGSWLMDGMYGFLLQHLSRGGVPDL